MVKTFENETEPLTEKPTWHGPSAYGFKRPPRLLFQWSRLLQIVVSQSVTYALTGKFHDGECGIYKCEGGCRIHGVGDLVLGNSSCYFDYAKRDDNQESRAAQIITDIVLAWDPNEPVDSMLSAAADSAGCEVDELKAAVEACRSGGPFGGDALSRFFDWNPFSRAPEDRDYERYCLIRFSGMNDEQVDERFADRDLGRQLLDDMREACHRHDRYTAPLCCSPRRTDSGLMFWVNTGRQTQIDGWKTERELRAFIQSGEPLKDTAKW